VVKGMAPAAGVGFGAEVFQENTIPGQHADASVERNCAPGVSSGNVSLTAVFLIAHPQG
jgi:hypothetical protein